MNGKSFNDSVAYFVFLVQLVRKVIFFSFFKQVHCIYVLSPLHKSKRSSVGSIVSLECWKYHDHPT